MANNKKDPGDIYCGLNMSTGKCYVGYTTRSLKLRIRDHLFEVKQGSTKRLHNSIRKHGIENFIFWVIHKDVPYNQLKDMEQYYVSLYKTEMPRGYNMTPGGEVSPMTVPEIAAKASKRMMGNNNPMKRPEVVAKRKETMQKPEVRAKFCGENHWLNRPGAREKHKESLNTPEAKEKRSKNQPMKDPEVRARHKESFTPEVKAQISKSVKKFWAKKKRQAEKEDGQIFLFTGENEDE